LTELEQIERDAYASLYAAAPADLAARGLAVVEIGGAACLRLPTVSTTMLNRVSGLGLERPAHDDDLDAIDGFFCETRYAIALAPGAEPSDLDRRLRARGFTPAYAWMKFRRDPSPPPAVETDLRVEEIGADAAADFGRVATAAYGLPDWFADLWPGVVGRDRWHCFVAYAGDEPAAAGALYASGRTGWFGAAGTLPNFRRRGGQGAIMAARIAKARELGLALLVTETGERVADRPSSSYRNILRFGFEEAYLRPNYERRDAD
jgi:GNAT superfamily N-acetyltransferase